ALRLAGCAVYGALAPAARAGGSGQMRAVVPGPPVATVLPSGEKAGQATTHSPRDAGIGISWTFLPEATSQKQALTWEVGWPRLVFPPASVRPSGENARWAIPARTVQPITGRETVRRSLPVATSQRWMFSW